MYLFLLLSLLGALLPHQAFADANDTLFNSIPSNPVLPIAHYVLTLTWEDHAPDGASRKAILTNGQLPGPTLYLDQGQNVEVVVINKLPFAITLHFHGIEQNGTAYSDGVPGLSQKPIQPGKSFIYRWNAKEYGAYWYHGHERGHISDGLYGAIIVKPDASVPSPFGLITNDTNEQFAMRCAEESTTPVVISDWSGFTSEEFLQIEMDTDLDDYCVDAVLIHGKGSVICRSQEEINKLTNPALAPLLNGSQLTLKGCIPADTPAAQGAFPHNLTALPPAAFDTCTPSTGTTVVYEVDPRNGWVSFDFIMATSINSFFLSIDEHPAWVYSVDGSHIEPVLADVFPLIPGERISLLVKLDKPVGDYTIRLANSGINQILTGTAILSYKGSNHKGSPSTPYIDDGGVNTTASVTFFDDTKLLVFPAQAPAATADVTYFLDIKHGNGSWIWTLSGSESYGLQLDTETPLLFDINSPEAKNTNLTITTKFGQWVDLIVGAEPLSPAHPLHKHANKGFVIGSGTGVFNYSNVAEAAKALPENFNFVNPPLRDGFATVPALTGPSWTIFRYQAVVPGAWLFHCHIQTHLDGGMAIAILDAVDRFPTIPKEYLYNNGFAY